MAAESPNREEHYDELDLVQIIREMYRNKWMLLGITLISGVLAAGYSLTKKNVYESSAALIVREPQRAIEPKGGEAPSQETPTLSVETLQTLTESTEVAWELFEKLREAGSLDESLAGGADPEAAFRQFQRNLSTQLKKQTQRTGSSVELLPILVLSARASSPEQAQAIANQWASIVEQRSSEIYKKGVEAMGTFIGEMYEQSNKSLVQLEDNLAEKELEAGLELKKSRLKTLSEKITMLEDMILEIEIELAVNEVAIADGEKRITEQEIDQEWVGTAAENALLNDEPYTFDLEALSEHARKVVRLVEQKVMQMKALREFRREKNLLGKEKRFEHAQRDLDRILAERAEVDDELPAVETAIGTLSEQLEEISETIVLRKAITDDALWSVEVSKNGKDLKDLVDTPLLTETLNPLFQSVRETIVDLTSRAETLRGSATQLEQSENQVSKETEELESEIDIIKAELDRRESSLEATTTSLTLLRDDYLEERKTVEELRLKSLRSRAERDTRQELHMKLQSEAETLQQSISDFQLEIDALDRETEKTKNVRTALASKAEEVALLGVAVENATRTGTTMLYQAQANPNKVAPSRSKLVLLAMAVTFLLCAAVIFVRKLVVDQDESETAAGKSTA